MCFGLPTMQGNTALGRSCPARPTLHIPLPLSMTTGTLSSSFIEAQTTQLLPINVALHSLNIHRRTETTTELLWELLAGMQSFVPMLLRMFIKAGNRESFFILTLMVEDHHDQRKICPDQQSKDVSMPFALIFFEKDRMPAFADAKESVEFQGNKRTTFKRSIPEGSKVGQS